MARVHNRRREGEYPTLTVPCTSALLKVRAVNHRVLNTFWLARDLMIGVNIFVYSCLSGADLGFSEGGG